MDNQEQYNQDLKDLDLAKLTVAQVIELPAFTDMVVSAMDDVNDLLRQAVHEAIKNKAKIRRTVVHAFKEKGLWNEISMTANYRKLLSGEKCEHLSSKERAFIRALGDEALHRTVQRIKQEKQQSDENQTEQSS